MTRTICSTPLKYSQKIIFKPYPTQAILPTSINGTIIPLLGRENESAIKVPYAATNSLSIQHNLGADSVTEYPTRQQI